MKKLFKPACLFLYLLTIIVFFFIGTFYVGISGAAKNQGLAGGAIVLWYGLNYAFFAFLASLFLAYHASPGTIVRVNKILGITFLVVISIFVYLFIQRKKAKAEPLTVSALHMNAHVADEFGEVDKMGMGFFSPDFINSSTLFFYSNPHHSKSVQEHPPVDSINFIRNERGSFDISYAPPWLQPEHLKLDYDLLYFKVRSLSRDFIEVMVNNTTQKTLFVSRYAGDLALWPEFLLGVHSVEFDSPTDHPVKIKPLDHASEVNIKFDFMHPLMIRDDWMFVELWNNDFKPVGNGWILWQKDGKLLIRYSLLS